MAVIERILSTLKNGFRMIAGNFKDLLIGFGKIYAATMISILVGMIVVLMISYVIGLVFPQAVLLGAVLVILVGIIGIGIGLCSHTFADSIANNKEFKLFETIKSDVPRNSLYIFVMALPIAAGYIAITLGQFFGTIGEILFFILGYLLILAWIFITQFASWEYVVGRKGIVNSIKDSYLAIVNNLFFVLPMDIILVIIIWVMQLVLSILISLMFFVVVVGLLGGSAATYLIGDGSTSLSTNIVIAVLFFTMMGLLAIIFLTIQETVFKPFYYYTWKEATKKK